MHGQESVVIRIMPPFKGPSLIALWKSVSALLNLNKTFKTGSERDRIYVRRVPDFAQLKAMDLPSEAQVFWRMSRSERSAFSILIGTVISLAFPGSLAA